MSYERVATTWRSPACCVVRRGARTGAPTLAIAPLVVAGAKAVAGGILKSLFGGQPPITVEQRQARQARYAADPSAIIADQAKIAPSFARIMAIAGRSVLQKQRIVPAPSFTPFPELSRGGSGPTIQPVISTPPGALPSTMPAPSVAPGSLVATSQASYGDMPQTGGGGGGGGAAPVTDSEGEAKAPASAPSFAPLLIGGLLLWALSRRGH